MRARLMFGVLTGLFFLGSACSKQAPKIDSLPPRFDGGIDAATKDGTPVGDLRVDQSAADAKTVADARPTPCITDKAAGHRVYSCQGIAFDVTVPSQCAGGTKPCGLVVDTHGFSMNAKMQDNSTAMRELGKKHGYVVIQPNANPKPPLSSWSDRDDAKVVDFITQAIAAWKIDEKRVHFTGFSQGGAMTWRMICKHSDLFASVAPAAFCNTAFGVDCFAANPPPTRQIPILYMHGTKDALINFSCATPKVKAVTTAWKLSKQPALQTSAGSTRTRYENASGSVFEFLQHDYSAKAVLIRGHCFPGSKDHNGGVLGQFFGFACAEPSTFVWGEEAMKFFIAHPKK